MELLERYLWEVRRLPSRTYTLRLVVLAVVILDLLGATIAAAVNAGPFPTFISGVAVLRPRVFYPIVAVTVVSAIAESAGVDERLLNGVLAYRRDPRSLPPTDAQRLTPRIAAVHIITNARALLRQSKPPHLNIAPGGLRA